MIKNNNIFKKNKEFFLPFICTFCLILSLSIFVSFSSNTEVQEVIVKSMTPVYDENSTVVITEDNGVIFNDKDQVVKYNVVIENTQNYDVKINDIKLSTPSEEFLKYEIEGIDKEDVIKANETKELVVSFETVKMEKWGRNFSDELTANITFDKLKKNEEPVTPEEDKEEPKQEEVLPEEDKTTNENNTNNGTGNTEPDKKEETPIVESKPSDKEEKPQTNIDKNEPVIKEETTIVPDTNDTEEDTNTESESINPEHELKPAPETKKETTDTSNNKTILIIVGIAAGVTGITIVLLNKNKFAKYTVFIIILGSTLTITNAEEIIQLPITLNVSYKSQNVMKPSGFEVNMETGDLGNPTDYWNYTQQIKNFYIENELNEITDYVHKFDVSEEQNGRVTAYLVESEDNSVCFDIFTEEEIECYDLHLQSDGVIYPNSNATGYFGLMTSLELIDNLDGLDTREVTDMSFMFAYTGMISEAFTLDVSNFDTGKVTDMSYMFGMTGMNSETFTLDVSNFDTSNVTDMNNMFAMTGMISEAFTLDVSNFDTSNVTNMNSMFVMTGNDAQNFTLNVSKFNTSKVTDMGRMFESTGKNSTVFTLDVSNFDTSNVTDMNNMFYYVGYNNPNFTLDVSNFDTSNVTDMSFMFCHTGYINPNFTLDVSNFDTSNVTDMNSMFYSTGYNSTIFTLDVSNFDTSNVTNMSDMLASVGYNSQNVTIDLSHMDASNVTDMKGMFDKLGYNSQNLTIDLSHMNASNVTNMNDMFEELGYNSQNVTIDLSHMNASNVTNMRYMFSYAGFNSENVTIDLSHMDASNVTDMSNMFSSAGYNSENVTIDLSHMNASNVTNMSHMFMNTGRESTNLTLNLNNMNTSNVDDMGWMFFCTGAEATIFNLYLDKFDTSNVTDMQQMFNYTGQLSTKFNASITIKNPNTTIYESMFFRSSTNPGAQITVNYTSKTSDLVDKMIATKSYNSNVVKGKLIVDVDNLSIGDEIHIENEKFNVISQTDDTVTMLAQYNLGTDYKQNTTYNYVAFSDTNGWEFEPGPKEIDIQTWSTTPKTYVNEYVTYLQGETGDTTLSGDLITLTQLKALGCTINDDYSYSSDLTCANSQYADWLVNSQRWWTQSALPEVGITIWHVSYNNGVLSTSNYSNNNAIRPIITISKETLKKLN